MSRIRSFALCVAGVGVLFWTTACAPAATPTADTADANAAFCASSAAARTEVEELKSLLTGGTATLDDIETQRGEVQEAFSAAADDAEGLAEEVRVRIDAADAAFDEAIDSIPRDATIDEAVAVYRQAADAWDAAVLPIRQEVGCP